MSAYAMYMMIVYDNIYSFIYSYVRKNILLRWDNQVTACGESYERKKSGQISNDSKSSAAVERSSGKRYRKMGTWEDSHEAWQNSGNTIILFKIYAILFFSSSILHTTN